MKKILAALFVLFCAPAAAQNYLRDDGIFHSVVEGTTNGQVLVNSGGLLAGTSSFPACVTCAVTNATNIFTADQKFSSGINITLPSGSTYTTSGAIQAAAPGGATIGGWVQMLGGALFLGTGATTTGIGTLGFPLGSGQVVFNLNSANASAAAGCGGAAIDFDNASLQTMTMGNLSGVTNCIITGITSYDATPTWKSNQGRWLFYSGSPTLGGSTTSMIGTFDYAQGMRVNLNTTLTFAALTAPLTGTSLQLTQANTTTNRMQMDSYGAANIISGSRSNGTKALPSALVLNDPITLMNTYGFGTSVQGPAGHVSLNAGGTWSGTSTPTYIDLCTTPVASTACTSRMRVETDGGITIGGTITVATSVTSPLYYGGASAGSTATFNGTSNGSPASAYVLLQTNGQNVGIGNATPKAPLDLNANLSSSPALAVSTSLARLQAADGAQGGMEFISYGSDPGNIWAGVAVGGTAATPTATPAAKNMVNLRGYGHNGTTLQVGGLITVHSGTLWSGTNQSTQIDFYTTPSATTTLTLAATFFPSGGFAVGSSLADPGVGKISATGGFVANGNAGVTKTCTEAVGQILTFTLGILTGTTGAGCV